MGETVEARKHVGGPVDVLQESEASRPTAKRCRQCGGLLDLRGRSLCGAACRLKRKTALQKRRRAERRARAGRGEL